jgi:hypothetical protein
MIASGEMAPRRQFLDLPNEILQQVVGDLFQVAGVPDAWHLRAVCRNFMQSIADAWDPYANDGQAKSRMLSNMRS